MGMRLGGHWEALIEDEEKKERPRKASDRTLLRWIINYLGEYKGLVIAAIILVILNSAISLVSPLILRYIIDDVLDSEVMIIEQKYQFLLWLSLLLFAVAIVSAILQVFQTIVLYNIGFKTIKRVRTDTFNKLQSLSLKYIDNEEAGRLISKVSNDCDRINEILSGGIITSLIEFFSIIGISGILLWLNWELALLVFAMSIPVTLVISWLFRKRARKAYRRTRKTIANVTANLSENISGVKVTKSFSREGTNIKEFQDINKENRQANMQAIAVFATTFPLFNFIAAFVTGFVYFYGGWTLIFNSMHFSVSIGVAIAFTQYIGNFFDPILNLTMFYNTFQSSMAATERVHELNFAKSDVEEKEDAYELPPIKGKVVFEDVIFGYKENELVLNHFNLEVKPGEAIAIVGPTGAGKTTIINLLSRFYEIQSGAIFIDGHNIQDVTLNSLHRQMGIVLQDPYLFSGSIKDNIIYNQKDVSMDHIEDVVKMVGAYDFIERMPQKYDTTVGERGGKLSLGQRQLISFARALLPDPKILVLDEATSSVDPYTEILIKKALNKLLYKRTSFIIAHRLSTVRNADRIVVLKNGKIVEEGNNDELLSLKGEYFRLYQLQFKDQEDD